MTRYTPMLARVRETPFSDSNWLFEVKWDGIRAIAYVTDSLSIKSRTGRELKSQFPELEELVSLTDNVVLDGEIIVFIRGRPNFEAAITRNQTSELSKIIKLSYETPATYIVFDILEKNGKSLLDHPLEERKKILASSLSEGKHVLVSQYVERNGEAYYKAVIERGLEGIIGKRKGSRYIPGERSEDWLKIKKLRSIDAVIFGYTIGQGGRSSSFGALILGLYDKGQPVYIGRVGTGFKESDLDELMKLFDKIKTEKAVFDEPDIPRDVVWLNPTFVVEAMYQSLTEDRRLRMPRFIHLREDKRPWECSVDQLDPLGNYREKRDFSKTSEPVGADEDKDSQIFVIQEHHARRLHWDLRLEREGVLKSWAVPKEPPDKPGERRLAVMVEDHPLEYGNFEGSIPEGEYGAGTVKIWDKGKYMALNWTDDKIEFMLNGQKLKGIYELIRFKKAGEKEWLLFKKRGD